MSRRAEPPAAGVDHAETVDAREQEAELRRQLAAAGVGDVAAGALLGLPMLPDGDVWVDIAGAAIVANRAQGTITSYLSRRTPKRRRADQDAAEAEDA
ncbi:MAG: hypothetical protein AUG49_18805 [Catenulispora sp. 13_1_20CM_3_70_7]|nr:MAG: hypothetical protein AUG49_18805 [Catenulispora sp. 13_1_20CM_3_70_7]